ncbi:uncharacterized protein LOC8262394 [Ricinus communis]|uniref:Uncharacterized protein n=1 Tax=Ricinus communis TaxID=3988 RepID=B9RT05_RICCO|nr:uncharacterized protein LOC8262394 [Ricinus communis]EEF45488.1 conserved hypothetical protein [Ricinus communis]|eukprot:XP_002516874.1 uncharacterized protein LOC8262394 [Ricinus communis]
MQVLSNARRLARVLKNPPILLNSAAANHKFLSSSSDVIQISTSPNQCQHHNYFSSNSLYFSGQGNCLLMSQYPLYLRTTKASFGTSVDTAPTEAVKELYDKILDSVNVKRTMSPNAWLWSMIDNCKNHEDIKLLFDTLQNLRRFRLSNLRIHDNFNCHLCREVTKACTRVGAIDFGKKALWKHNVYGLTPNIGSANHLLSYAKEHNDLNLMVEVMKLLKKNDIALQPSTTDTVFSICYNAGNWELICKYSKKFLKAGMKLRKTAFDMWMDFAIKRGDTESLWQIEKLRSESMQHHTLMSGFSCAKGLILEHKPEDAAAIIQILNQTLSDTKKPGIVVELQKLVSEWPLDVVKHQPEENRKAVSAALKSDVPAMVMNLLEKGLKANVNLEDLILKEEISS